jgi:aminoglycoside phosphotransferase (APT) family kinase protein
VRVNDTATAGAGQRLVSVLTGDRDRADKLAAIEAVAGWVVAVGRATRQNPASLDDWRRRLAADVLPYWEQRGLPAGMADRLAAVPSVLVHGDLWSWNVNVDGDHFTVFDWESSGRHGPPLVDLVYFLVDTLTLVADPGAADRGALAARLLRGELPESGVLFRWLSRYAAELGLEPDAVGPLVTACWLEHGLERAQQVEAGRPLPAALPPDQVLAPLWLADPALGPHWRVPATAH